MLVTVTLRICVLSDGARAPKIAMCFYDGNYAYAIQYRGVGVLQTVYMDAPAE